jgi:hypothetical protein
MILPGGRKHTVALLSLVSLVLLALLKAPAEYAYALCGMALGFFGAHGAADWARAKNGHA